MFSLREQVAYNFCIREFIILTPPVSPYESTEVEFMKFPLTFLTIVSYKLSIININALTQYFQNGFKEVEEVEYYIKTFKFTQVKKHQHLNMYMRSSRALYSLSTVLKTSTQS